MYSYLTTFRLAYQNSQAELISKVNFCTNQLVIEELNKFMIKEAFILVDKGSDLGKMNISVELGKVKL